MVRFPKTLTRVYGVKNRLILYLNKDLDNLTALILAAAFVMLSFIKEEEICINTDLGHSSMVWSACSSGKFKTPCKSKPLDQARHIFNSSSTEFLQALDMSPSYSLSDRCRGFCNPFEPRTGLGQVFNSSTVVVRWCQPLRFSPKYKMSPPRRRRRKKKKDDEYISFAWSICCHFLTWSTQNGEEKTKQKGEAAPGNADA